MEDLFKKFVNAGVGYIAQGSKSVQNTIEKLVSDNKMTQEEGKRIVDELMKSGETKRAELEKQFQGLAESIKSSVGLGESTPKSKTAPKKSAAKPADKAAGATKKTADKTSAAAGAGSAQKPAVGKAGAAKKPAAKKPAATASASASGADDQA